jgi:hypothetical protein
VIYCSVGLYQRRSIFLVKATRALKILMFALISLNVEIGEVVA